MMTAEQLAQQFHETYERLAPQFGYETRKESAKPWADVPEQNRKLMTAVCAEVLTDAAAQRAEKEREIARLQKLLDGIVETINLVPSVTNLSPVKEVKYAWMAIRDLQSAYRDAARSRNGQYTKMQARAESAEQRLQEAKLAYGKLFTENCENLGKIDVLTERLQEAQAQIETLKQELKDEYSADIEIQELCAKQDADNLQLAERLRQREAELEQLREAK